MDYNIYNYFDKDDSLGSEIQITINGYPFRVGKNVVIHKNINVVGDSSKETYIGHDTYIGEKVTIDAGSTIGARNILLKGAKINGKTKYESVINNKNIVSSFDSFLDSIQRKNNPLANKINIALTADDFGRNEHTNIAIEYYLSKNILNHASLMINREKSTQNAIAFIKKNNLEERIGMHFNVTEVSNKYSVNIKKNFGQKINSGKKELFVLTRKEKTILKDELQSQINCFKGNELITNYFDSHGHIHFKMPICKTVRPILLENNFKFVRIPMHSFGRLTLLKKIWNIFYKNKVNKTYTNTFNHFDFFIRAIDVFNLDNSFIGKTIEVMTHPFAYDNRYTNRRDIDFTCILGFIIDNSIFQII